MISLTLYCFVIQRVAFILGQHLRDEAQHLLFGHVKIVLALVEKVLRVGDGFTHCDVCGPVVNLDVVVEQHRLGAVLNLPQIVRESGTSLKMVQKLAQRLVCSLYGNALHRPPAD